MSFETWALFTLTEAVPCLTPGPAVLFVLAQGLGGGIRVALAAAAGILAGNSAARLAARPAFVGATNRVAGTLLIGAGLRIAALPR